MATLLLDRAQLEVRSEGETLALYEAGERRGTVPLALLDRCVIHGAQTRLDTGVLLKLAQAGVTTVLMSPRQTRKVALVLGPQHNDASVRLAQSANVLDAAYCLRWSQNLVRAKIARQRRTIAHWLRQRPDARKPLFDALHAAEASLQRLSQPLDAQSPGVLDSLRGIEGAMARQHFAAMAAVLPPALHFGGRNRRPPRDPANVCLSLGYTLLHSMAVGACHTAGLDPLLGFYHRPAFGRESLASDFIEPLRAAVDRWVWEMLASRTLREEHFNVLPDSCLLGKAGRSIYYAEWQQPSKPWSRWLQAQARQLARQLRQQGEPWIVDEMEDDEAC